MSLATPLLLSGLGNKPVPSTKGVRGFGLPSVDPVPQVGEPYEVNNGGKGYTEEIAYDESVP